MTLSEFQAWLEGFSASFQGGAPDKEQWEAIKAKLKRVGLLNLQPGSKWGEGPYLTRDKPPAYPLKAWYDALQLYNA